MKRSRWSWKGAGRSGRRANHVPSEQNVEKISTKGSSSTTDTTSRRPSTRLQTLKLLFEATKEGLAGIGIPGAEAIAGIPLLIIKYYEVCTRMLCYQHICVEDVLIHCIIGRRPSWIKTPRPTFLALLIG